MGYWCSVYNYRDYGKPTDQRVWPFVPCVADMMEKISNYELKLQCENHKSSMGDWESLSFLTGMEWTDSKLQLSLIEKPTVLQRK